MFRLLGSRLCTCVALCVLWLMAANGHPQRQFGIDEIPSESSVPQVDRGILPYKEVRPTSQQLQGTRMAQQQQLRIDVPVSGYLFIYEQATTSVVACLNAEGRTIPFSGRNQRGCAEFNFTMENGQGVLKAGRNRCGVTGYSLRCPSKHHKNYPLTTIADSAPTRVSYMYQDQKNPEKTHFGQKWIFFGNPSKVKGLSAQVTTYTTKSNVPGFYVYFEPVASPRISI